MSGEHEELEKLPSESDETSRQPGDKSDIGAGSAPRLEALVPRVSLVHDSGEPEVDPADDEREAHSGTLGEVTELVSDHACELLRIQCCYQRKPQGEHEVRAEDTSEPGTETRTGIDVEVDDDPPRTRCSDRVRDLLDEREERRFLVRLDHTLTAPSMRTNEERFQEEQGENSARDDGSGIDDDVEKRSPSRQDPRVLERMPAD